MHAFDCLGDPARRRILGRLVDGDRAGGEAVAVAPDECGHSRSGVSRTTCGCCATTGPRPAGPPAPTAC